MFCEILICGDSIIKFRLRGPKAPLCAGTLFLFSALKESASNHIKNREGDNNVLNMSVSITETKALNL